MRSPMYMTVKELVSKFGTGKKGQRRVSHDMIQWLLTDPPRVAVEAAAVMKQPIIVAVDPGVPPGIVYFGPKPTTIKNPKFNFDFTNVLSNDPGSD